MERIIGPTLGELRRRGHRLPAGVLYAGIILTGGGPELIEFNARFGDPEAEVVLPLHRGDLTEMLVRAAEGALDESRHPPVAETPPEAAVWSWRPAPGYPQAPASGIPISGLAEADRVAGVTVFHAGTRLGADGVPAGQPAAVSFALSARGDSLGVARRQAYEGMRQIHFDGMQFRTDIAETASTIQ